MSWQNILKASEDKSSLPKEKINRNALKFTITPVKPLVSRDNKLTYFLASYLDDAQTLKELISEWKESQKMLEYKNTTVGLRQLSAVINRIKKYFENIIPIETNRKSESDEQKTERLVEFFSKLPNPPTASDITTMENNLDILTGFVEKTKLTDKQKDENRINKVVNQIKEAAKRRSRKIEEVDISQLNATDLDELLNYLSNNKNLNRMKRLSRENRKQLKDIVFQIQNKDKEFMGIGYDTTDITLTLRSDFDTGKDVLSNLKFVNEDEQKTVKLPDFITEAQGRALAGGSPSTKITRTPLGKLFEIDEYSEKDLPASFAENITVDDINTEFILRYYEHVLLKLNKGRDKFLPYMSGSEKSDARILFGVGDTKSSKLNPTLVYLIRNFNLRLGKIRLAEITALELDKVFRGLSQGKYQESHPQLVTEFKRYVSTANPDIEEGERKFTGVNKFLEMLRDNADLYKVVEELAKKESMKEKLRVSVEIDAFIKEYKEDLNKINIDTARGRRKADRFRQEKLVEFKKLDAIKELMKEGKSLENVTDTEFEELFDNYNKNQDRFSLQYKPEVNTKKETMRLLDEFKDNIENFKINTITSASIREGMKAKSPNLMSMLMLCYGLSKVYDDREFEKNIYSALETIIHLKEYTGKDAKKRKEYEDKKEKMEKKFSDFMELFKQKYNEYHINFKRDSQEKIVEVITKPILLSNTEELSDREPVFIIQNLLSKGREEKK